MGKEVFCINEYTACLWMNYQCHSTDDKLIISDFTSDVISDVISEVILDISSDKQ